MAAKRPGQAPEFVAGGELRLSGKQAIPHAFGQQRHKRQLLGPKVWRPAETARTRPNEGVKGEGAMATRLRPPQPSALLAVLAAVGINPARF